MTIGTPPRIPTDVSRSGATSGCSKRSPNDPSVVIEGLQVGLTDVYITGGNATNCQLDVEVSWDGGINWSTAVGTGRLDTDNRSDRSVGSTSSTSDWDIHSWVRDDLSDARFQVRLTWHDGTAACPSSRDVALDLLEVRVDYRTTRHHDHDIEETDVVSPDGHVLAPQGFWGALQSQGAPNIQGDAYMTYYDTRTSRTNDDYSRMGTTSTRSRSQRAPATVRCGSSIPVSVRSIPTRAPASITPSTAPTARPRSTR